jgi:hypothetical protein
MNTEHETRISQRGCKHSSISLSTTCWSIDYKQHNKNVFWNNVLFLRNKHQKPSMWTKLGSVAVWQSRLTHCSPTNKDQLLDPEIDQVAAIDRSTISQFWLDLYLLTLLHCFIVQLNFGGFRSTDFGVYQIQYATKPADSDGPIWLYLETSGCISGYYRVPSNVLYGVWMAPIRLTLTWMFPIIYRLVDSYHTVWFQVRIKSSKTNTTKLQINTVENTRAHDPIESKLWNTDIFLNRMLQIWFINASVYGNVVRLSWKTCKIIQTMMTTGKTKFLITIPLRNTAFIAK